jgi:acyl dehydratase
MIIDQFAIFFDDEAAAASMTSNVVDFMPYAGRGEIFITLLAKGANTAAVSFAVTVQESKDGTTFTSVATHPIAKPNRDAVLQAIRIPEPTRLGKVRLAVAVTGAVAGLTLFAGVTRDHFAPYDVGLYINKGKVER